MTVTFQIPVAAPDIGRATLVIDVVDAGVRPVTVRLAWPARVRLTVVDPVVLKFVPVIETVTELVLVPEFGLIEVTVGAGIGAFTVNVTDKLDPSWPSGLMTVTFQIPAAAPDIGSDTPVIDVVDAGVRPVTVRLAWPARVRLTVVVPVVLKFVPVIETVTELVLVPEFGLIEVTVGTVGVVTTIYPDLMVLLYPSAL